MIVYKVCSVVREKYSSIVGYESALSASLPVIYVVQYKLGNISVPPPPSKYLFAFDKFENAENFYGAGAPDPNESILKCETDEVFPVSMVAQMGILGFSAMALEYYWKYYDKLHYNYNFKNSFRPTPAPLGTIGCKWLKPLEVIK